MGGGGGSAWKTRKTSGGGAGKSTDVEMGGEGNGAGSSGSPRAGFGTPARSDPKELNAKFWGNGKYENEEGQNKGGGGEGPQAP